MGVHILIMAAEQSTHLWYMLQIPLLVPLAVYLAYLEAIFVADLFLIKEELF
jgi:hypothetical protein